MHKYKRGFVKMNKIYIICSESNNQKIKNKKKMQSTYFAFGQYNLACSLSAMQMLK